MDLVVAHCYLGQFKKLRIIIIIIIKGGRIHGTPRTQFSVTEVRCTCEATRRGHSELATVYSGLNTQLVLSSSDRSGIRAVPDWPWAARWRTPTVPRSRHCPRGQACSPGTPGRVTNPRRWPDSWRRWGYPSGDSNQGAEDHGLVTLSGGWRGVAAVAYVGALSPWRLECKLRPWICRIFPPYITSKSDGRPDVPAVWPAVADSELDFSVSRVKWIIHFEKHAIPFLSHDKLFTAQFCSACISDIDRENSRLEKWLTTAKSRGSNQSADSIKYSYPII